MYFNIKEQAGMSIAIDIPKRTLALAQIFGLLPICDIFSKNIQDIKFKFLSIRTLYTTLWFISALTFIALEIYRLSDAEICKWEIGSWFFYVTSLHLAHIYKLFPVNYYSVIWAESTDFAFTFVWNYVDLFIMVMSLSISTKFKMINQRLMSFKGRIIPNDLWDEIRRHYNIICELNDHVDDLIGSLICVACLSDLYYVCLQILNLATPHPYRINQIYYFVSTIYLIARTFLMCLITSSINDESIKPLAIFRTIPNDGWSQQLQRLSNQIQTKSTALSGRHFFTITRGIIISIAGTIITYELVLIQFDGDKILPGMFRPCDGSGNDTST
ncbi:gustatory receptor for sugar taste 64e-like [Chironomus tepperi]|uniref:gustatory receptor for sugar taste 64e-like n=1 Tax=Chironomus tepperi TaxID=113505 RepID=UPI00391FAE5A